MALTAFSRRAFLAGGLASGAASILWLGRRSQDAGLPPVTIYKSPT
jgi:hypothetical protein